VVAFVVFVTAFLDSCFLGVLMDFLAVDLLVEAVFADFLSLDEVEIFCFLVEGDFCFWVTIFLGDFFFWIRRGLFSGGFFSRSGLRDFFGAFLL